MAHGSNAAPDGTAAASVRATRLGHDPHAASTEQHTRDHGGSTEHGAGDSQSAKEGAGSASVSPTDDVSIERFFAGRATLADLPLLEARGEYELLIVSLRRFVRTDTRVLTDAWVQTWLARRWRNFFIAVAATGEPDAVRFATEQPSGIVERLMGFEDLRSPQQRIASRFLVLLDDSNNKLLFSPGTKRARKAAAAAAAAPQQPSVAQHASAVWSAAEAAHVEKSATAGPLPFKGVGVDGVSYLSWTARLVRRGSVDNSQEQLAPNAAPAATDSSIVTAEGTKGTDSALDASSSTDSQPHPAMRLAIEIKKSKATESGPGLTSVTVERMDDSVTPVTPRYQNLQQHSEPSTPRKRKRGESFSVNDIIASGNKGGQPSEPPASPQKQDSGDDNDVFATPFTTVDKSVSNSPSRLRAGLAVDVGHLPTIPDSGQSSALSSEPVSASELTRIEQLWDFQSRSGIGLLSEWAFAVRDKDSIWWHSAVETRKGKPPLPLAQIPPRKYKASLSRKQSAAYDQLAEHLRAFQANMDRSVRDSGIGNNEQASLEKLKTFVDKNASKMADSESDESDDDYRPPDRGRSKVSRKSSRRKSSIKDKEVEETFPSGNFGVLRKAPSFDEDGDADYRPKHSQVAFFPGLLNGMIPVRGFQAAFPRIEKELHVHIRRVDAHPLRGSLDNIADLDDFFNGIRQRNAAGRRMRWKNKYPEGNEVAEAAARAESKSGRKSRARPHTLLTTFSDLGTKVRASIGGISVKISELGSRSNSIAPDERQEKQNGTNLLPLLKRSSSDLNLNQLSDGTTDVEIVNKVVANTVSEGNSPRRSSFANIADFFSLNRWKDSSQRSSQSGSGTEKRLETSISISTEGRRDSDVMQQSPIRETAASRKASLRHTGEDHPRKNSRTFKLSMIAKEIMEKVSASPRRSRMGSPTRTRSNSPIKRQISEGDSATGGSSTMEVDIYASITNEETNESSGIGTTVIEEDTLSETIRPASEASVAGTSDIIDEFDSESDTEYEASSSSGSSNGGRRSRQVSNAGSVGSLEISPVAANVHHPAITVDEHLSPTYIHTKERSRRSSMEHNNSNQYGAPEPGVANPEQSSFPSMDRKAMSKSLTSSRKASTTDPKAKNEARFMRHLKRAQRRKFVAITYSKGIADLLEYLVRRPERKKQISAVFVYAGAVYGSYVADEFDEVVGMLPRAYQDMDPWMLTRGLDVLWPMMNVKMLDGYARMSESRPIMALKDLTTYKRTEFMKNSNKEWQSSGGWTAPFFSITGATTPEECPYFQSSGFTKLSDHDVLNDMQLTTEQGIVKSDMSVHLAVVRAHHWDMAFGAFPQSISVLSGKLKHPFPKYASASAMILLALELGLL